MLTFKPISDIVPAAEHAIQTHPRLYVYVAGPYTSKLPWWKKFLRKICFLPSGEEENVRRAIEHANTLLNCPGVVPVVPHLSHFWHLWTPKHYEKWLELDLGLILRCDVLLRMNGPSDGADREVRFARGHKIPVVYGVVEFYRFYFEWAINCQGGQNEAMALLNYQEAPSGGVAREDGTPV